MDTSVPLLGAPGCWKQKGLRPHRDHGDICLHGVSCRTQALPIVHPRFQSSARASNRPDSLRVSPFASTASWPAMSLRISLSLFSRSHRCS